MGSSRGDMHPHLKAAGRPLTAFAACELRSPAPFTEGGFRAFNETYVNRWSEPTTSYRPGSAS